MAGESCEILEGLLVHHPQAGLQPVHPVLASGRLVRPEAGLTCGNKAA